MIHLILNFEFGDVTIVTDDEQIKAHKYVVSFVTFFDTFLKKINHQYIFILIILNFELGDVTIVADDEQIRAHKSFTMLTLSMLVFLLIIRI